MHSEHTHHTLGDRFVRLRTHARVGSPVLMLVLRAHLRRMIHFMTDTAYYSTFECECSILLLRTAAIRRRERGRPEGQSVIEGVSSVLELIVPAGQSSEADVGRLSLRVGRSA